MTRITESELIIPSLYFIARKPGITTSELILELTNMFHPTGEDAQILSGRSDSKFSQIVRNLVAHHTIDEKGLGYVVYEHRGSNGFFSITESGQDYLHNNLSALNYLLDNQFQYQDLVDGLQTISEASASQKKILDYDENTPINEGRKKLSSHTVTERSLKLRNAAIQYYSVDGHILCEVCGFDFLEIYGEIGDGFIEMHHKKPLFQYEDEDSAIFLNDAILGVAPLCSNCHRMIHRNRESIMDVDELKRLLT